MAKPRRLASMTISQFADQLSTDSPAPGGGSVAAMLGAMAASLGSMVAAITAQKKDYAPVLAEVSELGSKAQTLKQKLLDAIDDDTDSFNAVLDAMRLPKVTQEEQTLRTQAMERANQGATSVPLEVMRLSLESLRLNAVLADKGFKQSQSDAGVGALAAMTALEGAYYNVRINLPTVTEEAFKTRVVKEAAALFSEAQTHVAKARAALDRGLSA